MTKGGVLKERMFGSWPYDERSTRNCFHCKTFLLDGKARVYCSKGKHLSLRQEEGSERHGLSLQRVLVTAGWISRICENCILFEHDYEVGGIKR